MSEIGSNEVQGYHNSIISAELSFQKDLKLLLSAMDEFENLFSDNSYDLYSLDTGMWLQRQQSLWKTAQYSKKHNKLWLARNNVALFSHLFISCQTWVDLFFLPLYQNMRISDQQKKILTLLDIFSKKILAAPMKVQMSAQKYLKVQH